jgi:hypothetical protein
VIPEAPLKETEAGLVAAGEGWFVINAREARWRHREGWGNSIGFQGDTHFAQIGIGLVRLEPGEPNGMYQWRPTRTTFSCSPAKRSRSSRDRSGPCSNGTWCTVRPAQVM